MQLTGKLFYAIAAVSAVIFAVTIGVVYFAVGFVVKKPLSFLTNGVDHISSGDLTHHVKVASSDEFGALATAFNTMSEALRSKDDDLRGTIVELDDSRDYVASIINSMPSVLIGVDSHGYVTHWNAEAVKVTGISAVEAKGQVVSSILPFFNEKLQDLEKILKTEEPHIERKELCVIKNEERYFDITIYPLMTKRASGAVIKIDEVTERKKIDEMMVQTEKMVSVGGLAAGMAHEINNPLGGILQGAQNIVRRTSHELKQNEDAALELGTSLDAIRMYMEKRKIFVFLDGIQECGIRASQIVKNMLQFSRRGDSDILKVNLPELINKSLELASKDYDISKKFDFRHIAIEKNFDPDICIVPCIQTELEQVVLNLLKNAAYAMSDVPVSDKVPKLTLSLSKEGNNARIEISDNGPGIPSEIRSRIFEPFFTTKPVGTGTGLGLSVSYMIITQNHNGTMNVESTEGEGTTFIITIPLKQDH